MELARRLGLHKSTSRLCSPHWRSAPVVEQDEESGKACWPRRDPARRTGRAHARPAIDRDAELDRLARATRETTGLGVLTATSCRPWPRPTVEPRRDGDWTGRCVPVSLGRRREGPARVAAEREVLRLVRRGLDRFTDKTIVNLEPLLEELARVRRRGFATAFGEFDAGLNAVAAPVHDARGQVIAAVDVWGPAFRVTPRRVPELVQQVRETAGAVSVRLGGTPGLAATVPLA
jgi:DNA-binding IclR family transcriptional regulator